MGKVASGASNILLSHVQLLSLVFMKATIITPSLVCKHSEDAMLYLVVSTILVDLQVLPLSELTVALYPLVTVNISPFFNLKCENPVKSKTSSTPKGIQKPFDNMLPLSPESL
ncbi:hypothetical protein SDC9_169771 [bioreactor metagenome]|uniref:Uncharacterized protein n=1 Tax=bioreactor metagenome TaxID=1076179 RepID=A0A645G684_9ZZZZ